MTLQLPTRTTTVRWFLGADGQLAEGGVGTDDLGADVAALAETNVYAPAGIGGESLFTNLRVAILRSNAAATLTLRFTPIVDGVDQAAIDLELEAVASPARAIHELGLSVPYPSALDPQISYGMRGSLFAVRVETVGALPSGLCIIEGIELEHETVTEGRTADNATS